MWPLHIACQQKNFDLIDLLIFNSNLTKYRKDKRLIGSLFSCLLNNKSGFFQENIFNFILVIENAFNIELEKMVDHDEYNMLHMAILNQNDLLVENLLNRDSTKEFDVKGGPYGDYPTHLAARLGHEKYFKLLCEKNFKTFIVNSKKENLLNIAASNKKNDFIRHLFDEYDNLAESLAVELLRDNFSQSRLSTDAKSTLMAFWEKLERVLELSYTSLTPDVLKFLIICIELDDLEKLKEIFGKFNDPNMYASIILETDQFENTLLHKTVVRGNFNMTQYLLSLSSDLKSRILFFKNECQETVFHIACKRGDDKIVELILKFGNELNNRTLLNTGDMQLNTGLHLACLQNRFNIVKILVADKAIDKNAQNIDNHTAGHICCQTGNLNMLKHIMDQGGHQSIDWLHFKLGIRANHIEVVDYLIQKQAPSTEFHTRIFDEACETKNESLMRNLLTKHGSEWRCFLGVKASDEQTDYSRFKILTCDMPKMAELVLDKSLVLAKSNTIDFGFLDPSFDKIKNIENHPLMMASLDNKLIFHQVVKKLVKLKWQRVKYIYYINLIVYLLYVASVTIRVIDSCHEQYTVTAKVSQFSTVATPVCLVYLIVKQLSTILFFKKSHFFLGDSIFEFGNCLLTVVYLFNSYKCNNTWMYVGSFVVLLNWLSLTIVLQKISYFGLYALMFKNLFIETFKVVPLLFILLLGFSFSLAIFKDEPIEILNGNKTIVSFALTMSNMLSLSPSEWPYSESYFHLFFFIFFMIIMCLLLANVFIGLFRLFSYLFYLIKSFSDLIIISLKFKIFYTKNLP